MAYTKKCECCGKEFKSRQPNAKYCSKACKSKQTKERKIERITGFKMSDLKNGMVVVFANGYKAFFYKRNFYKFDIIALSDWFKSDLTIKKSTNLSKNNRNGYDEYDIEKVYRSIEDSIGAKTIPLWERQKAIGVFYDEEKGKWKAHFKRNGKQIHLGVFNTFEEALEERKRAEKIYKLLEDSKEGE